MDGNSKLISINGVIKVQSDTDHQEFINKLFLFLQNENWHFRGESKIQEGNTKDGNNNKREDSRT